MKRIFGQWYLTSLVLLLLLGSTSATCADAEATASTLTFEQKLATCEQCHGPGGSTPIAPNYPKLGGQYQSYLQHALKSYQLGRRDNPVMVQQIQGLHLTDDDIERLALYYANQGGLQQIR